MQQAKVCRIMLLVDDSLLGNHEDHEIRVHNLNGLWFTDQFSLHVLCSFGLGISNLEYSVLVSTIKPADVNALQAINQI
jgi:hypothetical protein